MDGYVAALVFGLQLDLPLEIMKSLALLFGPRKKGTEGSNNTFIEHDPMVLQRQTMNIVNDRVSSNTGVKMRMESIDRALWFVQVDLEGVRTGWWM